MPITDPSAHSGEYASVTNDTTEYSYAFQELLKNINAGVPKKIVVSGWVYTTVASPKLGIILNVSENKEPYDWKVYPLTDNLTETGKWVEFSCNFFFQKPFPLTLFRFPEKFFRIKSFAHTYISQKEKAF